MSNPIGDFSTAGSNDDLIFGKKELYDLMDAGQVVPLNDEFMIPDVVSLIQSLEKENEFFKQFKKKRVTPIDEAVKKNEEKITFFRQVIVATMDKSNQTAKKFPGVCRINLQSKKNSWVVKDADKLIQVLKDEKEYDRVVETKESIKKDELNKLLDTWKKIDKIPDCVELENADAKILKITSLDKPDKKDDYLVNSKPISQDDMDVLEIV